MKYFLFLMCLVYHLAIAQNRGLHVFTINGTIRGKDSGYVYFNYIPNGEMGIYDSIKVSNGHFIYKGTVTEPTKAWFNTFGFGGRYDEENMTQFYIEPGELKLYATYNHFKTAELSGSASDSDRIRLQKLEEPIQTEIDSVNKVYWKYDDEYRLTKGNNSASTKLAVLKQKQDSIVQVLNKLEKIRAHIDSVFIVENPGSYVAADMISHSGVSWIAFPSLDSLYAKFPVYIQQSFPGKKIKLDMDRDKAISIGGDARLFIAKNSKGDTVRLSDYKEKKYVLLDFGASWCRPCRAIIPLLKEYYAKYFSGMEIISISNQDEETDWRKAINEDQVEWTQIIENRKIMPIKPTNSTISDMYYISGIPSLILIDKNLKIIGKYGGFYYSKTDYLPDLEQKLDKIFSK